MTTAKLFTPLHIRDVEIRNRAFISPMWQYCGERGHPTDWHLMHYGRFAEGGAGLVIQEGTTVEKRARGTFGDIGIWDDEFVPGLARIVRLVKQNGATPGIQLMHAGRKVMERRPWEGKVPLTDEEMANHDPEEWDRIAPSAVAQQMEPQHPTPREMSLADIADVTTAFVDAARRADEAGYEVVEIHAAHGYLIHTFLSDATNKRTDQYGGSFENRTRFLTGIVEGVRSVWPEGKPLFVRVSCVDGATWSLDDTIRLAKVLKHLGVDLIDCSSGGIMKDVGTDRRSAYAYQAEFAAAVRAEAGIMTNAVGLIIHPEHAEAILRQGQADSIAIGREALYNPNWTIDAARKLGVAPEYEHLPERQRFWFHYREKGMDRFRSSTQPLAV